MCGAVLTPGEVDYVLAAFDVLLRGRRPSAQLAAFVDKLRKSGAAAYASALQADTRVSHISELRDPAHPAKHDLVDTAEAATILGVSPAGVRDLCRRGRLAGYRAGGRWLCPVGAVVARAERQAARRR
jgi:hypothetical protein